MAFTPNSRDNQRATTGETTDSRGFSTSREDEHKRDLINALEDLRGLSRGSESTVESCRPTLFEDAAPVNPTRENRRLAEASDKAMCSPSESSQLAQLRDELRSARATCSLLEEEVKRLEQKALSAIAEAGRLRCRLDQTAEGRLHGIGSSHSTSRITGKDELRRLSSCVQKAQDERRLLTRALSDSESEIARLSKTINLLVRKLPMG